ncbi:MAG: Uma2 family endonuclease [Dehalococcoidia bacterium]|nr:Uma2 family endonuclease [Dehalococcoidia bacterium]
MVARRAVLSADESAKPEIFYPETDGMPLADGFYQLDYFVDIISVLKLFFKDNPRVAVSGDSFIYFVEGDPFRWIAPDCYVALDISMDSIERFNTYRVWEVGKIPDFVLEIGSPSTARNDLGEKRDLYAQLGFGEYWLFDPSGGEHYGEPLIGQYLEDGAYRRFDMRSETDGTVWARSPVLNLDLRWEDGRLRFYDPETGRWLRNMEETDARAEAAEARAKDAEAKMAEMAAELRRMRGE